MMENSVNVLNLFMILTVNEIWNVKVSLLKQFYPKFWLKFLVSILIILKLWEIIMNSTWCFQAFSNCASRKSLLSNRVICLKQCLSSDSKAVRKYGSEIYYGSFERTLKFVKIFSLTNSFVILCALPFFFQHGREKLLKYKTTTAFVSTMALMIGKSQDVSLWGKF